jgi:hypothetical protein
MSKDNLRNTLVKKINSISIQGNVIYLKQQDNEPHAVSLDTVDNSVKLREKIMWLHHENFDAIQISTFTALVLNEQIA